MILSFGQMLVEINQALAAPTPISSFAEPFSYSSKYFEILPGLEGFLIVFSVIGQVYVWSHLQFFGVGFNRNLVSIEESHWNLLLVSTKVGNLFHPVTKNANTCRYYGIGSQRIEESIKAFHYCITRSAVRLKGLTYADAYGHWFIVKHYNFDDLLTENKCFKLFDLTFYRASNRGITP